MTADKKEQDFIELGNTLLNKMGLTGWKVVINRRLRETEGRCVTATRSIELHPQFWVYDDPEQTILHEIAHAIHWERIKDIHPNDAPVRTIRGARQDVAGDQ